MSRSGRVSPEPMDQPSTATMRACVLTAIGDAATSIEYRAEHPPPPPRKPGEVLIEARTASINPADWKIRRGLLPKFAVKLPQIQGLDVAGVVKEADATSKFKPGDRVFGAPGREFGDAYGTWAELVCAREDTLLPIPEGVTYEQAAAVPMAGMTAWQALAPSMPLMYCCTCMQALAPSMPLQGKRVFVHGGAGGIGAFAIQVAKAQGAYIATTCSTGNVELVKALGADLAVDYTKDKFEEVAGELYDVVVCLVSADSYESRSYKILKRSGRLAQVAPEINEKGSFLVTMLGLMAHSCWNSLCALTGLYPRYSLVMMEYGLDKGLRQVSELLASGQLKVHIDKVFPMEEIVEAHQYGEKGHTKGKVLISIAPGSGSAAK